jgi:16S rRNA processing protein RimM
MNKRPSPSEAALAKQLPIIKKQKLQEEDWLPFGHVAGAHGIRGALKIKVNNPDSEYLQKGVKLGFELPSGDLALMTVSSVIAGGRVHFEEMTSRNDAESWLSTALMIRRQDLPDLLHDEVYLVDLLGAKAIDTEGKALGEIVGFSDNRAQHLVQIKTLKGSESLLPFVAPILHEIREAEHIVVFDPPLGWDDD